jgi:adenylate kinase
MSTLTHADRSSNASEPSLSSVRAARQMAQPVNLVMVGPPGAGKGTQAVRLARALDVPAISTGDMLRRAVQADTPVGRAVKATMERGELIGDQMMTDIVAARLREADTLRGCVLDGFPRTVDQAHALDRMMANRGVLVVAELAVPETALMRRLNQRRVCERCGANAQPADANDRAGDAAGNEANGALRCRCGGAMESRSDDREDVVRERLRLYECATRPLVDFYRQRRMLRVVDGTLAPDLVTAHIASAIKAAVEHS